MPKPPNQSGTVKDSTPFEMDVPVQMDMSDEALITFVGKVPGGMSFHDVGYMPVNAMTIAGNTRNLPGGGMDRMFISYTADGVQHFPSGYNYNDEVRSDRAGNAAPPRFLRLQPRGDGAEARGMIFAAEATGCRAQSRSLGG